MKKSIFLIALAVGLMTSCASKKDLANCQTENKSLTEKLQDTREDLAGKNTVDRGLRGVEPASKVVERNVARRLPERRAVAHGRHRVEVRYEHEHVLALRLKVEHGLHRAEVVAPVQRA